MSTPTIPFYPMTHDDAQELIEAVRPSNVCVDLDISIAASDWSDSSPYTYNWMNNKVTPECAVKVNFLDTSSEDETLYIGFEKIAGGVQFTAPVKPTEAIAVRIHILNAEAASVTSVSADMVSSSAITGASNVEQGLTSLNSNITTLNSKLNRSSVNFVLSDGLFASSNAHSVVKNGYTCLAVIDATVGSSNIPAWTIIGTSSVDETMDTMVTIYNASSSNMAPCSYASWYDNGISLPIALSANTRYIMRIYGF